MLWCVVWCCVPQANVLTRKRFPENKARTLEEYLYNTEACRGTLYEDSLVEFAVQHYLTEEMGDSIVPMLDIIQTDNMLFLVMVSPDSLTLYAGCCFTYVCYMYTWCIGKVVRLHKSSVHCTTGVVPWVAPAESVVGSMIQHC